MRWISFSFHWKKCLFCCWWINIVTHWEQYNVELRIIKRLCYTCASIFTLYSRKDRDWKITTNTSFLFTLAWVIRTQLIVSSICDFFNFVACIVTVQSVLPTLFYTNKFALLFFFVSPVLVNIFSSTRSCTWYKADRIGFKSIFTLFSYSFDISTELIYDHEDSINIIRISIGSCSL